jgi:hypothetical protein
LSLQRSPLGEPPLRRVVQAHLGSALRFSQPLSGFLANPSFVALFRATSVPGTPPFRVFPSQKSPASLEAAYSLTVIHRRAELHCSRSYYRWFQESWSRRTKATFPSDYGFPFRAPKHTSRLPWISNRGANSFRWLHPSRSLVPPASPFTSSRGCPETTAAPLLGFLPSGVFSFHASGSPTRPSFAEGAPWCHPRVRPRLYLLLDSNTRQRHAVVESRRTRAAVIR